MNLNKSKLLLLIKTTNLWGTALLALSLLLFIPIVLSLLDLKTTTELTVTRTTGLSLSFSLMAIAFFSLLTPKYYWLHELTFAKVWGSGLAGVCLFTYLFNSFATEFMMWVSITIWLCLLAFIASVIHLHQHKNHSALEYEYNQFDQSTIFDPAKSDASHIIEVKSIEHGEKFGEFLLDHGFKLEILSVALHGGHLLKITKDEHSAYVKTTNLSLDNFQRFTVDGERQHLTSKPIWNIEIAFPSNTGDFYNNVLSAVLEMNKYYQAKLIQDIKVWPYQMLNTLFEHNHSLCLHGNKKLISLAYHKNEIEITTEHEFEDTKVKYIQITTVWLSDCGLICSESKGINKDLSVATENVPLSYVDLPFKDNLLWNIQIQKCEQDNPLNNVLVLIVQELINGKRSWNTKKRLAIDLNTTPITIKTIEGDITNTMLISEYRKKQCYSLYELRGVIDQVLGAVKQTIAEIDAIDGPSLIGTMNDFNRVMLGVMEEFLDKNPEFEQYEEEIAQAVIETMLTQTE